MDFYLVNYGLWVSLIMPRAVRVLCEGISDFESIIEIFKKENINNIGIRKFDGRERLLSKVNQYIQGCWEEIDIFIILVDSHCTNPSITEQKVSNTIDESIVEKVRIHVIKHALETWFLAEGNAINRKYRKNFQFPTNPEGICKPDEELKNYLRRAGRLKYIKSKDAKAIARLLDTEKLKNVSKNFNSFIKLLRQAQNNNN